MKLLTELRTRLSVFATSLRARRAHGDQLEVEVCLDITADVAAVQAKAYTAQQADLEAVALLEKAKLGGLDSSDLPLLERAIRNITRSAEADRQITESLA